MLGVARGWDFLFNPTPFVFLGVARGWDFIFNPTLLYSHDFQSVLKVDFQVGCNNVAQSSKFTFG